MGHRPTCRLPVSELMLMRRARAYGSSFSQLESVYLHPFRSTSLFCSQQSHKITKFFTFLKKIIALLSHILLPWQQGSVVVKFGWQYLMAQKLWLYLIHSRSYDRLNSCLIFPIGAIVIFWNFLKINTLNSNFTAWNFVTEYYRQYAIIWWKPEVSISPRLATVPERDKHQDTRTELS